MAGERYGEASGALAALERLPDDKVPVRALAAAAALIVLAIAAYFTAPWLLQQPAPVVGPAPAPPPPAARIAAAQPGATNVRIDAGDAQPFAIELDPKTAKPAIVWSLDGTPIDAAKNRQSWTYTSDASAADASHQLAVQVGDGKADAQQRAWALTVVGKPAPPPERPIVAATRIGSAQPATAALTVGAGAAQPFAIELDPKGATDDVQWLLDGKQVAAGPGRTTWDYRADPGTAGGGPHEVVAKVGQGTADGQTRSWSVKVAANSPPQLIRVLPQQGQELRKDFGQTASFAVEAKDVDGDPLRYQWSVDGQPAGVNKPSLDVPVERESQRVALAIDDGKQADPVRLEWKIKGSLGGQPATLRQLAFGDAQPFKITPPAGATQIAWAVNGQKVGDGASFLYRATNPELVGTAPVQLRATATDAAGKPLAREWSFTVAPPPPPKITAASPPAGVIEAAAGTTQKLALNAAQPVSGQSLTYVFDVNGKQTTSSTPSIAVSPSEGGDTTVVAAIEDNFKQRSKETRWTIRPGKKPPAPPEGDASASVTNWIDAYRTALNRKDVPKQCALLQLDAGKCAQLDKAMTAQSELKVAFDNLKIEPLGDGRASAQYTRVDEFVDPSGRTQTRNTQVTQTFRIVNGTAQLDRSSRP